MRVLYRGASNTNRVKPNAFMLSQILAVEASCGCGFHQQRKNGSPNPFDFPEPELYFARFLKVSLAEVEIELSQKGHQALTEKLILQNQYQM